MALFVTGVGALIHLYSIGYMHGDPKFSKFFLYLNLFVFSMLMLVLGDNLLLTFLGWEGVGACSYFLISFWFDRSRPTPSAGKKAFVTNRVGDWGFMVAHVPACSTVRHAQLHAVIAGVGRRWPRRTATAIALLLFLGAVGKSAQLPLYVWLPDAMAGPTPVSALIHAATMVTAGVYLMVRINPILHAASPWLPDRRSPWSARVTALFAATIAVRPERHQEGAGLLDDQPARLHVPRRRRRAPTSAAIFHMITHAFFKALLFLGAGSVIHGMHDEQDMRRMGALRKYMPITAATFIVGWLAIAGVPAVRRLLVEGRDPRLRPGTRARRCGSSASSPPLLTAFYMSRQVFLVFFGKARWAATGAETDEPDAARRPRRARRPHESPWTMTCRSSCWPCWPPSAGVLNLPFGTLDAPRAAGSSRSSAPSRPRSRHVARR